MPAVTVSISARPDASDMSSDSGLTSEIGFVSANNIDTTINSKKLNPLRNQLKKYSGIIYYMGGPKNGKRPLVFKKIVDIVENVEFTSTQSTESTKI